MNIIKRPSNDHFLDTYRKEIVVLHGTAGGSEIGAHTTLDKPDKVDVPYLIARSGTIVERFDPKYWAYHTGKSGICKISIGIENVWWGWVNKVGGKFYSWTNKEVPADEVIELPTFCGKRHYHTLTQEQIYSNYWLILQLKKRFPTLKEVNTHTKYSNMRYDFPPLFPDIEYLKTALTASPIEDRFNVS